MPPRWTYWSHPGTYWTLRKRTWSRHGNKRWGRPRGGWECMCVCGGGGGGGACWFLRVSAKYAEAPPPPIPPIHPPNHSHPMNSPPKPHEGEKAVLLQSPSHPPPHTHTNMPPPPPPTHTCVEFPRWPPCCQLKPKPCPPPRSSSPLATVLSTSTAQGCSSTALRRSGG